MNTIVSRVAHRFLTACEGGCGCTAVVPSANEAVLVQRVALRFADRLSMEHPSEEAKKNYLKEHPNADPSNHKVKQRSEGGGGGAIDHALAESEGPKGHARFEANKKSLGEMKALQKKVDDANPAAKKKFDREYDKLYENGEKAAGAAKKLLQKYTKAHESLEGEAKEAMNDGLEMLHTNIKEWERNKMDHANAKARTTHTKLNQAQSTYAYAQQLDGAVKDFAKFLKDPEKHQVDESWRHV